MAVEHKGLLRRGQFPPGRVQRDTMLQRRFSELCLVGAILGPGPGIDRALVQRFLLVGDDQVEIEVDGVAEALAALAGAIGVIEGEQPGLGLAVDAMAKLAFKGWEKRSRLWLRFCFAGQRSRRQSLPTRESRSRRRPRSAPGSRRKRPGDRPARRPPGRKSRSRSDSGVANSTILPFWYRRLKPPCAQLGEPLLKRVVGQGWVDGGLGRGLSCRFLRCFRFRLRGNPRLYGKQRIEPGVLAQGQDGGGKLIHRVALDHSAANDAMRGAAAGEEQTEVIVNLRGRGHSGAWVAGGVLLLDGNGRRQAVDQVHVRLLDALQELPGIGGKRLDVAALAFRIDGVKGERGFA